MALTKKEQQQQQQQQVSDVTNERDKLKKMLYSLLGIKEVIKDVPIPDSGNITLYGWDFNTYTGKVFPVWSTAVSHGTGQIETQNAGSKNGIKSFSTQELATIALHNTYKLKMLEDLIKIT